MKISEALRQMKLVLDEVGDVEVALLDQQEEFFAFLFPDTIEAVGMPNDDEKSETLLCAFTVKEIIGDVGPRRPKLQVVK